MNLDVNYKNCLGIHHSLRESIPLIDHSDRKESLPSQQSGSRFEKLHCVPSGTSGCLILKKLLASTFSRPFNILNVSIRSPLCLRQYNECSLRCLSLCSYVSFAKLVTSFVALRCTFSPCLNTEFEVWSDMCQ